MTDYHCCIRLHGAFVCSGPKGTTFVLGAKQQAILAILATSPDGVRTRSFLQSTLWSAVAQEQAAASLRTALSTLRKTLGDASVSEEDAVRALKDAGAWEFVAAHPGGILENVGERGARFSGGQRQRIVIARALAHGPRLLILDEATSALDPKTEAALCETLAQLKGRLTILSISHQPALVDVAERVYRIEKGQAHRVRAETLLTEAG